MSNGREVKHAAFSERAFRPCEATSLVSSPRSALKTSHVSAKASSSEPQVAKCTLELFSGSGRLTSAFNMKGLRVCPPFDVKDGKWFDLCNVNIQQLILGWIRQGRIWYLHLGTPCTNFSIAKTNQVGNKQFSQSMQCAQFTETHPTLC